MNLRVGKNPGKGMIDYVKIELPCTAQHLHGIAQNLDWERFYPKTNHSVYRFENLEINVYSEKVILTGSLHKFYNSISGKGSQNYDDFKHSDFIDCLNYLSRLLKCDIWQSKPQNLEFGVNIPLDANNILPMIVSMRGREKSMDRLFKNGGRLIEFEFSQYWFKIYNKAAQHDLSRPLIRVEIKAIRHQYLSSNFGIHVMSDLKEQGTVQKLKIDLLVKLENLLIFETPDRYNSEEEEMFIKQGTNPKYWSQLRKQIKPRSSQFSRKWSEFTAFIKSAGLDDMKTKLMKSISKKWDQLVQKTCQKSNGKNDGVAKFLHLGKEEVKSIIRYLRIPIYTFISTFKSIIQINAP
jgi:hypothetical protein